MNKEQVVARDRLARCNRYLRMGAALALGRIQGDAAEAIPHLQLLLKDPQPQIRGAAAQALIQKLTAA